VREAARQEKSLPLMLQIRDDMLKHVAVAEGKVRTAINYAQKSWDDLQRFIFDGRIEIDSNSIERCMRGIALSKKNSLFAGSHDAAKVWAIYYTLFETARMNGVNPRSYLNWVVIEIERHRGKLDHSQLMPWHCPVGRVTG
jgi:transposase